MPHRHAFTSIIAAAALILPVVAVGPFPSAAAPAGQDSTLAVLNAVVALYSAASLRGCTLSTGDLRTCVPGSDPGSDPLDNFSRTEIVNGASEPAGAAIGQLCAAVTTGGLGVDVARSTQPPTPADGCPGAVGLQFAWDSVPLLVFPNTNANPLSQPLVCNRGDSCPTGEQLGPVAGGWRIGDGDLPSGVPFTNLDNRPVPRLGGNSVAFELFCDRSTGSRTVNDGIVTAGSQTLLSASPDFTPQDVGSPVFAAGLPLDTEIVRVNSATSVTLNHPASSSADPAVVTVGTTFAINDWQQLTDPALDPTSRPPTADDATLHGTNTITTTNPDFSGADLGASISGPGIPGGTMVTAVTSATTAVVSHITDTGSGVALSIDDVLGREGRGHVSVSSAHPGAEPIYFPAVNPTTGTYAAFSQFVGCDSNAKNADGQMVQGDDSPELARVAARDHPTDNVGAANQLASTLYYLSYGFSSTHGFATSAPVSTGDAVATTYGEIADCNGVFPLPRLEVLGPPGLACVRALYLVYDSGHLTAPLANFLSWVCYPDNAGSQSLPGGPPATGATHGTDVLTGLNYAEELYNAVSTQFLFPPAACGGAG